MEKEGNELGKVIANQDFDEYVVECWISEMINNIDNDSLNGDRKRLFKSCSLAHYQAINMANITSSYKGRIDDFIFFLENEWNWKVKYDKTNMTVLVDENKSYCVCPLVKKGITNSPILCNCSEGFAEKMFTDVLGKSVKTEVVQSVLRGDKSCMYKIYL